MKSFILFDVDTMLYRVGYCNPAPETAAFACSRLQASITTALYKIVDTFGGLGVSPEYVLMFLTKPDGLGRYRDKFNHKSSYKENRSKAPPPVFMEEMRDFINTEYVTHNAPSSQYEADDAISWFGWDCYTKGESCVIAGVDKDLNQIPGNHYDYGNGRSYHVGEEAANRFFFQQLLTGDTADNIPGIKGIGVKRANTILSKGANPEEWWDTVLEVYTNKMPHLSADDIANLLYERGNKLWIQRYEGQTWYPPIPEGR